MLRITTALFFLTTFSHLPPCAAQDKHDYVWCMGYGRNDSVKHFGGTRIDFTETTAVASFFPLPERFGFNHPCSISDGEGRLQFYSNGCRIINADHELIENGEGLNPGPEQSYQCDESPFGYDAYQGMLILPKPGHSGRYLYFHNSFHYWAQESTLYYTEIDMTLNGGKGRVLRKNQFIRDGDVDECAFTAVRHGNGRDWWLILPQEYVNVYNLYLVGPDTIQGPYVQDWETGLASRYFKTGWNVAFSPDGRKFARVTLSWLNDTIRFNQIFLYDFDRCTGTLCNPKVIRVDDMGAYASWAVFSPNSRFLYFQMAQDKLYQFDLEADDVAASGLLIGEYDGFRDEKGFYTTFYSMVLAPNGKIYMGTTSSNRFLHTIHAPNERGLACDFRQHDFERPTNASDLPNYPNYRLYDVPGSLCDTLGIDGPQQVAPAGPASRPAIRLSPNPAVMMVNVHLDAAAPGRLRVFNLLGQMVLDNGISGAISTVCFAVDEWPEGTYVVSVDQKGLPSWSGKLVVVRRR